MNPDFLKALGYTAGALIGGPLAYAAFRIGQFFGAWRETTKTMTAYVEESRRQLADHERRIGDIEIERETERRMQDHFNRRHIARRAGDPPPADESSNRE